MAVPGETAAACPAGCAEASNLATVTARTSKTGEATASTSASLLGGIRDRLYSWHLQREQRIQGNHVFGYADQLFRIQF